MSPLKGLVSVAAIVAAAGAGLWAGQTGLIELPTYLTLAEAEPVQAKATGPAIYYRDPNGKPFYSLAPRTTDGGEAYVAVHADEDISFDPAGKKAVSIAKADSGPAEKKIKYYRNPMGLPDTSPVPKKDSMGMDYIPVYEGEDSDDGSVKVSLGKIQRTGVTTVMVRSMPITNTIKVPGVIQFDERRLAVVAPRFDGYVVKMGAATTGAHVKRGDVLATVFSQDLLNWGARLITDQGFYAKDSDSGLVSPGSKNDGLGASRRLENLGAPEDFIETIKRTRHVPDMVTIRAPIDGFVLERNLVDGQAFKAGDVTFRIGDHSLVWMMADVAEVDIGAVKPGQSVRVTTRTYPGRVFEGKVAVIYPQLMKETRTARVRIELPNPDLALLPDMYGEVEIATGDKGRELAVPSSAVIYSGNRRVVLLDQGNGRYEPRDVNVGRQGDGYVELLSGVSEGDKVVVNGNFLIDAESNLEAALKGFQPPETTEASQ